MNNIYLLAHPIHPPQQEANHHKKELLWLANDRYITVMTDTLQWTKILKDTNYQAILDSD